MPYEFVGTSLIPSEVLDSDICVNQAYPNLRIAYQPAENRAEHSLDKPFALVDQMGGFIIKELSEDMARNTPFLLRWLYENDSSRHGEKELYNKFLKTQSDKIEATKKADKEKLAERTEIAHAIASSPLHTYRINGRKVGADNDFPYIGIDEMIQKD
jgi:hypothetical protein